MRVFCISYKTKAGHLFKIIKFDDHLEFKVIIFSTANFFQHANLVHMAKIVLRHVQQIVWIYNAMQWPENAFRDVMTDGRGLIAAKVCFLLLIAIKVVYYNTESKLWKNQLNVYITSNCYGNVALRNVHR